MRARLLRGATTVAVDATGAVTHPTRDVRLAGGVIDAVGPAGTLAAEAGDEVVDLDGYLLLPAAVEAHAHLDKAFLAERVDNPTGDLPGAIEAMRSVAASIDTDDIATRAERAARLLAANGYVAVRTHVDVTVETGLRSVLALDRVRRRVGDVIDVEIVALAGWPITGPAGADHRRLLVEALASGADLVGGCPHLEDDPTAATDLLLQVATDHRRAVDLHTDETLDPAACGLDILADRVLTGFAHGATASHCVSLGQQPESTQRATAEKVAAAGVAVVALPHTNLFLLGRRRSPVPRGLTAVEMLLAAGVTVAAGADNLQDPFNPVGRACPFETAGLMVLAAHLLPHDAWTTVSDAAATALGRRPARIAPGEPADLLAVEAATVREAIAFGPPERLVWRRGEKQHVHDADTRTRAGGA